MCRNIRPLNNFEPPATRDEVHAAALQYVRKVSGTTKPSQANQEVFDQAVREIAHITEHLLDDLVTTAPPKNREVEAEKARARAELRYALTAVTSTTGRGRRASSTPRWRCWPGDRSSCSPAPGCPPTPASRTTAGPGARRGCR